MSTLQINKTKYQLAKYFAIASFGGIFLLSITSLQPLSFGKSANAESQNVDVSVTLEPTISISTNVNSVSMAIDPNNLGSVVTSDTVTVNVGTNNPSGYTLSLSSNSSENALLKDGTSTAYTIPTLSSPTTSTTWASDNNLNNKWGFTHNNTDLLPTDTYLGVPASTTSGTTIKSTTSPANTSETNITFATKIDETQPAGSYENTVVLSAVANTASSLWLQDMTTSDCATLPVYDSSNSTATTYTRYDKRDGQPYKIRRLYMTPEKVDSPSTTACWMVENLRLTGERVLTPNDSNVDTNFTLTASNNDTWCTEDNSACDDQSMMIDAHTPTYPESYLYNWYAATAGTGTYNISSGNATASICPGKDVNTATWHLPSGTASGEWYRLFNAYKDDYGWSTISGTGNTTTNNLSTTIGLNFVYSGYRYGGNTGAQGVYGLWWSHTAGNNNSAYLAYLNSGGNVYGGTGGDHKNSGRAVRCLLSSE